jgi:acyl-coenzyme A synthetase/AMP-(fatty) acid ligase
MSCQLLLERISGDTPFAIHQGRILSRSSLWQDVNTLAEQLPDRRYLFNLCENRYWFCVCLLAAAARRQICLLPPSNQAAVIDEIRRNYPDVYLAGEIPKPNTADYFAVRPTSFSGFAPIPDFDWQRPAVIAFTSGSTSHPKACCHSLKTFALSAKMAVDALGLSRQCRLMLSTTPPQHMYGLETSVFWPLFSQLILYDERPFFPEDIRQAIATAPYPVMLMTTPTHLRSLVKTDGEWNNLAGIISATDTLPAPLARQTFTILGQSPYEIYGSTETLSFAWRDSLCDKLWQPYTGCRVYQNQTGENHLESPHLPVVLPLQDYIGIKEDGRFEILGRHEDMIKIGGKRASLAELNQRLNNIDGIDDGFYFLQMPNSDNVRLAAVVVSELDRHTVVERLRPYIDNVFLPRKVYFVNHIPRNEVGKLTRATLEKLLLDVQVFIDEWP